MNTDNLLSVIIFQLRYMLTKAELFQHDIVGPKLLCTCIAYCSNLFMLLLLCVWWWIKISSLLLICYFCCYCVYWSLLLFYYCVIILETYAAEQRVGAAVGKFKDRIIPARYWRYQQQVAVLVPVFVDVGQVIVLGGGRRHRWLLVVVVDDRNVVGERDPLMLLSWHTWHVHATHSLTHHHSLVIYTVYTV